MNIYVVTPAAKNSPTGNRRTALRWASMLRAVGHRVQVTNAWAPDTRTQLLLALHARRSYDSIAAFAARHPYRPLVVALTGTDLYRDLRVSEKARRSLALADRLIVLQTKAMDALPSSLRAKTRVVVQSCATTRRHCPVKSAFRICVIGHLRDEKDPLLAAAALASIPEETGIEVVQLGAALDEALGGRARNAMARDPRYRWLGSLPHTRALAWLASSHAMLISSRIEGGANVVSEALRVGVPVLASRIPGNEGLLGKTYPGYFPVGNDRALARLMRRAARDSRFYRALKKRIARLRPTVSPRNEARNLIRAVLG
jgi:putative glycosyltransferase (TIGR04348 family)